MLYLAGNQDIVLSCLNVLTGSEDPSSASGVLRITQRMRLESTQLEGVQRKLREPSNYCMCLALASSSTHNLVAERNDMLNQIISFQNMISYLQDKTAAGIISCSSGHEVRLPRYTRIRLCDTGQLMLSSFPYRKLPSRRCFSPS